jgi:hypothetical protein
MIFFPHPAEINCLLHLSSVNFQFLYSLTTILTPLSFSFSLWFGFKVSNLAVKNLFYDNQEYSFNSCFRFQFFEAQCHLSNVKKFSSSLSKKTQRIPITKNNLFMLFTEVTAVHSVNHIKPNTYRYSMF